MDKSTNEERERTSERTQQNQDLPEIVRAFQMWELMMQAHSLPSFSDVSPWLQPNEETLSFGVQYTWVQISPIPLPHWNILSVCI